MRVSGGWGADARSTLHTSMVGVRRVEGFPRPARSGTTASQAHSITAGIPAPRVHVVGAH
jgi:hypothetical protein